MVSKLSQGACRRLPEGLQPENVSIGATDKDAKDLKVDSDAEQIARCLTEGLEDLSAEIGMRLSMARRMALRKKKS
jgi:hypothetical protein